MYSEPRPSQLRLLVDIAANIYNYEKEFLLDPECKLCRICILYSFAPHKLSWRNADSVFNCIIKFRSHLEHRKLLYFLTIKSFDVALKNQVFDSFFG